MCGTTHKIVSVIAAGGPGGVSHLTTGFAPHFGLLKIMFSEHPVTAR